MRRRFGLTAKFTSLIAGLLSVIFAAIAIVLLHINTASLRTDLLERSKAFAALATKPIGDTFQAYQESGSVLIDQQINNFARLDKNISNVSVINLEGKIAFSLKSNAAEASSSDAQSFEPIYKYTPGGAIQRIIYPYVSDSGRHTYGVAYDVSSSSIDAAVLRLERSILIYSVLGLAVSTLVTYFLINRLFLEPIKRVSRQATIIAHGYYSERITEERNDEIGDLALNVNQMSDSLKADLQKLKEVDEIKSEFMMIASHNLRTPLTVIDGYIDLAKGQTESEELLKMLSTIEANSHRLGIFAEDLLIISSIEAGQNILTMKPMQVDGMLDSVVKEFKVLADEKKVAFSADIEQAGVSIEGSSVHLRSAIWNMLDNALKFTEPGGSISLNLKRVNDQVQISVKDTGIGIAPEEIGKLFTKFHRGTSTQTYNYEGTGIGLYISKLIIDGHNGSITVDSALSTGSTFTITLPILPDKPA